MKNETQFTPFDPHTWARREVFHYYANMAPTGYSITVTLDVTRLRAAVKRAGYRFFPTYLWLVTRALNRSPACKTAEKDGKIGCYDSLTPLYAHFHADTQTFSLMWTAFDADFRAFHAAYLENQRRFGENHGILAQPDCLPPENAYVVSCVPWISFSHFAVHARRDTPYYLPSVEAGRWYAQDGKTLLPLSFTCHHAATDGWHLAQVLALLQDWADDFEAQLG